MIPFLTRMERPRKLCDRRPTKRRIPSLEGDNSDPCVSNSSMESSDYAYRYVVARITAGILLGVLWGGLLAAPAQAQQDARYEIFLGYSYLHTKPDGDINSFGMHGAHMEIFVPMSQRFGPVLDLSGHVGTADAPPNIFQVSDIEISQFAITSGIRYNGFQWRRLRGALRALVGISRGSVRSDLARDLWIEETAFAAAFGGSMMLDLSDWVALRLIQPNFFLTTFGDDTQLSSRYSTGLIVRITP